MIDPHGLCVGGGATLFISGGEFCRWAIKWLAMFLHANIFANFTISNKHLFHEHDET